MIQVVQKPTEQWDDAMKPFEERIREGSTVTRLLMPAVMKVSQAEVRVQAILRTAIVALAAERFRLARGRWPNELSELTEADLLKQAPTDPYTGTALHLVRKPFGVIVYSVGQDRKDDGGLRNRLQPYTAPGDIVFHVFDPKCRRATPEELPMPRELDPSVVVPGAP